MEDIASVVSEMVQSKGGVPTRILSRQSQTATKTTTKTKKPDSRERLLPRYTSFYLPEGSYEPIADEKKEEADAIRRTWDIKQDKVAEFRWEFLSVKRGRWRGVWNPLSIMP